MKPVKKLTENDVTPENVFNVQRRQILKMLGISTAALSVPGAQADLLSWFKDETASKAA